MKAARNFTTDPAFDEIAVGVDQGVAVGQIEDFEVLANLFALGQEIRELTDAERQDLEASQSLIETTDVDGQSYDNAVNDINQINN